MVTAATVFSILSFYLLVLLDAYLLSYSKIMMTITVIVMVMSIAIHYS